MWKKSRSHDEGFMVFKLINCLGRWGWGTGGKEIRDLGMNVEE